MYVAACTNSSGGKERYWFGNVGRGDGRSGGGGSGLREKVVSGEYGATRYIYDTPYTARTRKMKTQNGHWNTNPHITGLFSKVSFGNEPLKMSP